MKKKKKKGLSMQKICLTLVDSFAKKEKTKLTEKQRHLLAEIVYKTNTPNGELFPLIIAYQELKKQGVLS